MEGVQLLYASSGDVSQPASQPCDPSYAGTRLHWVSLSHYNCSATASDRATTLPGSRALAVVHAGLASLPHALQSGGQLEAHFFQCPPAEVVQTHDAAEGWIRLKSRIIKVSESCRNEHRRKVRSGSHK